VAEGLSDTHVPSEVSWITTILVDSMQVYREIPIMTNQARSRPAALAGVVSVTEEWNVARHKESVEEIIGSISPDLPFVLDAGTGMYLNAIVLDIQLAPKVMPGFRLAAERLASGAENPRREARRLELEALGSWERGSIWNGLLRYDATFVYVRPPRDALDRSISARSSRIVRDGIEEAMTLKESVVAPNASVREAIGVKEMLLHVSGDIDTHEAEETIALRTRRLARRQIRWFDKLARSVPDAASRFLVLEQPSRNNNQSQQEKIVHLMHDIMER
jgi:tRNA dimethylallyltransferase